MATTTPFAYNTGAPIGGTSQLGDLAIGITPQDYSINPGGKSWWMGPDEELGYVIAVPVSGNTQPTPIDTNELFLNPSYKGTDVVLSNFNQTAYQQFGYQQSVLGSTSIVGSDVVMFSVLCTLAQPSTQPDSHFVGIGYTSMNYEGNPYGGFPGNDGQSMGYKSDGTIWYNGALYEGGFESWGNNDIIDIAINNNYNAMWVRVNGGYWNNNVGNDPAANIGGFEIIGGPFFPVLCPGYEGTMTIQSTSAYSVPNGFTFLGITTASVGFYRSTGLTDNSFVDLTNQTFNQNFSSVTDASIWLTNNGFWTSYPSPVLYLDAGNPSSYPGSGATWTDMINGRTFNLINGPTYSSNNGGTIDFVATSLQYADCASSLPDLNIWSVGVWYYFTNANSGLGMCLVTETYPGLTGNINYSLGDDNGNNALSSGFFNGGWQTTGDYNLTPNAWYYIVGTYDGFTNKLYVNNNLVMSNSYTGTPISSQGGIRLMSRWDNSDYWGGSLSVVGIYDRALSSGQISTIWNAQKSRFGYSGFTITSSDFVNAYTGYQTAGDNTTFTISGPNGSGESFYGPIFSQNSGGSTIKADEIATYFTENGLVTNNNAYLFNATWASGSTSTSGIVVVSFYYYDVNNTHINLGIVDTTIPGWDTPGTNMYSTLRTIPGTYNFPVTLSLYTPTIQDNDNWC